MNSFSVDLNEASSNYIKNRSYESLELLSKTIKIGMTKTEVQKLLGEADYSPTEGIYYYSSGRYINHENRPRTIVGLVVTYGETSKQNLQVVKEIKLGPIGE